jgi:hypothetical protein
MESNQPLRFFKSGYDSVVMFYLRGDLLRPQFGEWDAIDPVSHILLDLVEAQSELSDLFHDAELACLTVGADAFRAAVDKRHEAGKRLLAALEDRSRWPDPNLGKRR